MPFQKHFGQIPNTVKSIFVDLAISLGEKVPLEYEHVELKVENFPLDQAVPFQ